MGRAGKDNRGHMTLLIRRVQIVLILNEILGIFFRFTKNGHRHNYSRCGRTGDGPRDGEKGTEED